MSLGRKVLLVVVIAVVLCVVLVAVLINWPDPTFDHDPVVLTPETAAAAGLDFEQAFEFVPARFAVRDGIELFSREFLGANDDLAVVLLHGVAADSTQLNTSAGMIRAATDATVFALDLRGHGASEGIAGDVDYVGQYEDDVLDVIGALLRRHPGRRIV
ncbi:MAG: hypothetical protein HC809_09520, partial [Gammaproteobacteria bacterium]|nr:hypothetical protein [Gammaproteobacteria bacterium]